MPEPIQITTLADRTVLRLKSWLPTPPAGLPARTLCIGPGDWLIVSSGSSAPEISGSGLALVDLSDGLVALAVSGPAAREVLSKGCGLDLHRFAAGKCTRTRFAQIPVVLECLDETRFELHVARSYLHYLRAWLTDAALEFGDART